MDRYIRTIPNFPKNGINFIDFLPTYLNPDKKNEIMEKLIERVVLIERTNNIRIDKFALIESRGFDWGSVLADRVQKGYFYIRKKEKLPPPILESKPYLKEYADNPDILVIPKLHPIENIVIIDDILATGNTMQTAYDLLIDAGHKPVAGIVVVDLNLTKKKFTVPIHSIF